MEVDHFFSIDDLHGQEIVRWVATEMALSGGDFCVNDETTVTGWAGSTCVVWQDDSIPYRQFVQIDMELVDGRIVSLVSLPQDGTNLYGLDLVLSCVLPEHRESEHGGIYRVQELNDFPKGRISVRSIRRDEKLNVLEAELTFCDGTVRFLSAEIYERDGGYVIVEQDESVLVQMERSKT